jgi:hypothetical protein
VLKTNGLRHPVFGSGDKVPAVCAETLLAQQNNSLPFSGALTAVKPTVSIYDHKLPHFKVVFIAITVLLSYVCANSSVFFNLTLCSIMSLQARGLTFTQHLTKVTSTVTSSQRGITVDPNSNLHATEQHSVPNIHHDQFQVCEIFQQ